MDTEIEYIPGGEFNLADLNKQKSVLIVEDDPFQQIALENVLKLVAGDKYLIEFANNGETAVQMVQKKIPSIIFTDINLGKGINGF